MIVNNEFNYDCPCCKSSKISKIGNLNYQSPIKFSTEQINLTETAELWRCQNCYSSFTQNRIAEKQAVLLYSLGQPAQRWSQELFEKNKPAKQVDGIRKYCQPGMKVLDVGCNTGELLDYQKRLGCATYGVEYSSASRKLIQEKGHIAYASILGIDEQFDVITAFDLVEHLYNVPDFLRSCQKLLKKDGILIILTGNIRCLSARLAGSKWWYASYPEHVCFPSKKFLNNFSGFQVAEILDTYASRHYIYPWIAIIKQVVRKLIFSGDSFNGLPSLGPDHIFAVLKNEK